MEKSFKSYIVEEKAGNYSGTIKERRIEDLPQGELLIQVSYSSLNYKDALSAAGNKGVTKSYPHTPGIDAAGTVVSSTHPSFKVNDKVIVTSYDLGMNTDGGFSEFIRVPASWALRLPENLTLKEAMIYGTAGLTAGISVSRLTEVIKPDDGKIIVSGATGGVGSMSTLILSHLGYYVTAVTGKTSMKEYLLSLGAREILLRSDFESMENRPLLKPLFLGAIDTVGGVILENIIKSTLPMGIVTCCGNVATPKIDLTVFPFILRGISLVGIDSQNFPMEKREMIWNKLSIEWKPEHLGKMCNEITLEELNDTFDLMRNGKLTGRTIIKLR